MSWAGGWFPRAYFGTWFGAEGTSTLLAAGPPFVWVVAEDGRAARLAQDQAIAAVAADGWRAQLVDFAEGVVLPDGWTASVQPDLVLAAVADGAGAAIPPDDWTR